MLKQKLVETLNYELGTKQRHEISKLVEKSVNLIYSKAGVSEHGESAQYTIFEDVSDNGKIIDNVIARNNQEAINRDMNIAGYNMIVASECEMNDTDVYNVYRNLKTIEDSFSIIKSQLEARPVHLQNVNTIKGHFLIYYLSVTLYGFYNIKPLMMLCVQIIL